MGDLAKLHEQHAPGDIFSRECAYCERDALKARVEELEEEVRIRDVIGGCGKEFEALRVRLIRAREACPNCGGQGWTIEQREPGIPEQVQCSEPVCLAILTEEEKP